MTKWPYHDPLLGLNSGLPFNRCSVSPPPACLKRHVTGLLPTDAERGWESLGERAINYTNKSKGKERKLLHPACPYSRLPRFISYLSSSSTESISLPLSLPQTGPPTPDSPCQPLSLSLLASEPFRATPTLGHQRLRGTPERRLGKGAELTSTGSEPHASPSASQSRPNREAPSWGCGNRLPNRENSSLQPPASPARLRPFPIYAVEGHQDYISRQATATSFSIQTGTRAEAGAIERILAGNHGKGIKKKSVKPVSVELRVLSLPINTSG